ncbi:sugar ABC transporter ATP-binding protein [Lachnospiraceae bacterium oral taxon 500]|nr:sugar ABC transporter ATP-binding protein [Lachnospiraceae bacterium oral taxon 500]
MRTKKALRIKYIIMTIVSLIVILPYLWMLSTSLKTPSKIFVSPPQWIPDPVRFENFIDLFTNGSYGLYLWNSFKVAFLTTVGTVIVSTLAGYALAKIKFPGRNFFFILFLSAMMLPVEVITIPTFLGLAKFNLTNSHFALIVPQIFGMGGAFGVFMMRQYFITVPNELVDAGKIDGCDQFGIFIKIILPMASSTIASLVIYTFFNSWNDYFLPLIYLSDSKKYTSTLALSLFADEVGVSWNLVMAASLISTLPLLIVFFGAQKKFIESMAMSGIK